MQISTAEAKNRLPELLRRIEGGERVIITRHGKPVAQLVQAPMPEAEVRLGTMRERIQLLPGWDEAIDPERFLEGDL